jgi:hypothetical protein
MREFAHGSKNFKGAPRSRPGSPFKSITADLADVVKEAGALPQSAGTLNARRAALMDIANLNGLIVNRNENGRPGDFSIAERILARWKANRAKLDAVN